MYSVAERDLWHEESCLVVLLIWIYSRSCFWLNDVEEVFFVMFKPFISWCLFIWEWGIACIFKDSWSERGLVYMIHFVFLFTGINYFFHFLVVFFNAVRIIREEVLFRSFAIFEMWLITVCLLFRRDLWAFVRGYSYGHNLVNF